MRSNATVGPPVECVVYRADSFSPGVHATLDEDDDYLLQLRRGWANNIRSAFDGLPSPPGIRESMVRGKVARIT